MNDCSWSEQNLPKQQIKPLNKELIRAILDYYGQVYYTDVLAIICQFIALISGIKYYKQKKEGLYFIIYIFSWLMSFTVAEWITKYFQIIKTQNNTALLFEETFIATVSMIEFCCFSFYLYRVLKFQKHKMLIKILAGFFVFPAAFFFRKVLTGSSPAEVTHLSFVISSVVLFLIAIPCLLYYYELLMKTFSGPLFKKPSFIIITALLLYCLLVVPFFLVADKFQKNKLVNDIGFTIHLTSFCLLFLAMTWAFRLNKSLTE